MAADSKIEWTDHTFNPWIGCTKVSRAATGGGGCDNCYAEVSTPVRVLRGKGTETWGVRAPRVRTSAANWALPKRWNAQADAFYTLHGRRQQVFCASLADVFDNEVPIEWLRDLCSLIELTPNLDWLLLTKRIGNVFERLIEARSHDWAAGQRNVLLGITVCNQAEADRDIPKLLRTPARLRFLSMEPLLGPVSLRRFIGQGFGPAPNWVIVGGESGPGARPMHPDWARSLRDQCANAGVPFLFKQWGEWAPTAESAVHPEATRIPGNLCRVQSINAPDRYVAISFDAGRKRYEIGRVGKKAAGRLLDGREWNEVPA
jgi:protein gp37